MESWGKGLKSGKTLQGHQSPYNLSISSYNQTYLIDWWIIELSLQQPCFLYFFAPDVSGADWARQRHVNTN